jgi:hypothetical protein
VNLSISAAPVWSITLVALLGAWVGHFLEFVRVSGWQAGLVEMTSSVHTYFFPAGAGLVVVGLAAAALARRAWSLLGGRLSRAQATLWTSPGSRLSEPDGRPPKPVGIVGLWIVLTALQVGTWMIQENLEAVALGHRAPLFGVIGGAHRLAPVVQAEVALILAALYVVVHGWFRRRRSQIRALELTIARKWRRGLAPAPVPAGARSIRSTPFERWGATRWQRPPPIGLLAN